MHRRNLHLLLTGILILISNATLSFGGIIEPEIELAQDKNSYQSLSRIDAIRNSYLLKARSFAQKNWFDSSYYYYQKEFDLINNTVDENYYFDKAYNRLRLAELCLNNQQYTRAILFCDEGILYSQQNGNHFSSIIDPIHKIMHTAYDALGDVENSIKYYNLYSEVYKEYSSSLIMKHIYKLGEHPKIEIPSDSTTIKQPISPTTFQSNNTALIINYSNVTLYFVSISLIIGLIMGINTYFKPSEKQ